HRGHRVFGDGPDLAPSRTDGRAGAHIRRVRAGEGALTAIARTLLVFLLAACAPLTALVAQAAPPRPDSARTDTTKRVAADTTKRVAADSTKRAAADSLKPPAGDTARAAARRPPRDTIKTPIARPYTPRSPGIGANHR